jgi:hypothetical protein
MAIVCRQCGKNNADRVEFCVNPECGAYLGWDIRQTGSLPAVGRPGQPAGPAPPVGHTQTAAATVTLPETVLAVQPGEAATTTATVFNGGSQVEQFAMSVLGPTAAWATVEPTTLRIFPAGQAQCTVRFAPPREATTPPGPASFTVQAASTLHPGLEATANGWLDVGIFREVTAVLVPQQSSGRGRTRHRIDITNAGNVTEPVRLEASDAAGKFHFGVPAGELALRPGKHSVPVPVRPPARWLGQPTQHPFTVTVTPRPALAPIRLDGSRELVPLIAGWLPKAGVALVGIAAVVAALALLPGWLPGREVGGDPTAQASPPGPTASQGTPTATPTVPKETPTPTPTAAPPPPAPTTQTIVVDAEGNKSRGSRGTEVTRKGPGEWEVTFDSDMRNCAYVATVGDAASEVVSTPGLVFTASGQDSDNGVYVVTVTPNGKVSDFPFHLVTRCGTQGPWVVSDNAGNMNRGNGVKEFRHVETGEWEITFDDDMTTCVYVASIGDPGKVPVTELGLVFTASGRDSANGVRVQTMNRDGAPTDFPFHLQIVCPKDRGRWVVTDNEGRQRRGTAEDFRHVGRGQWEVDFNQNVRGCTHLATVGDPGSGTVDDPGLVFTSNRRDSGKGVFVETKNLGGGLQDFPFHLRTVC